MGLSISIPATPQTTTDMATKSQNNKQNTNTNKTKTKEESIGDETAPTSSALAQDQFIEDVGTDSGRLQFQRLWTQRLQVLYLSLQFRSGLAIALDHEL